MLKQLSHKTFLLFAFFISLGASATHNRAGEILYKRIAPFFTSSGAPVYTYSFTVIKYTDDGPGIADRCADTINFGDGTRAVFARINGPAGCQGCSNCGDVIIADPNYRVKINIYTGVHTYAGPGVYTVSSLDPNRTAGVHNIPNSDTVPFYIESVIVLDPTIPVNSSPVLSNPPLDRGLYQSCFYHNPGAYDSDGDSLSYELVACKSGLNQVAPGYFFPETGASGSFSINAGTGLLSWCNPQFIDQYNIAILIKEWRQVDCNGPYRFVGSVTRDMQVIVVSNTVVPGSFPAIADACVTAGQSVSRTFNMSTGGSFYPLSLLGSCTNPLKLPNAVITETLNGSTLNVSFNWQTSCIHAQKQAHQINLLCFNQQYSFYKQFNVRVAPPKPVVYNVTIDTSVVTLRWHKVSCVPVYGYYIYRKIGLNPWTHGACETGVPASSGFQYRANVGPADTSFTENLWGVPNGSIGNYIITVVTKDCAESFADSVITIQSLLVGLKDNAINNDQVKIYPNPFNNNVQIELDENYHGQVEALVYAPDGKLLYENSFETTTDKIKLQLNNFAPGIYLLRLNTSQGTVYRKIVRE